MQKDYSKAKGQLVALYDILYQDLVINNELCRSIHNFRLDWIQKSSEYSEFLGTTLMGVHNVRFSIRDDELFISGVLGVDMTEIREVPKFVKGIPLSWEVSSNPIYQSVFYVMHKIRNSNLNIKVKQQAELDLYYIFAYRATSSLLFKRFRKYTPDPGYVKIAFDRLSNRYILKKEGSWGNFFKYRAADVVDKKGSSYKEITRFNNKDYLLTVNDLQGRIRDVVNNYFRELMQVMEEKEKLTSTTAIVDTGEAVIIADITERPDKHIGYIKSIINNHHDFINDELIHLLKVVIPKLDDVVFKKILLEISKDYDPTKLNPKDDYVSISVINNINYLSTKGIKGEYKDNILDVLNYCRGYWTSSSVKDPEVLRVKKYLNKEISKISKRKTRWVVTSSVIGVILYIFLRTIVQDKI